MGSEIKIDSVSGSRLLQNKAQEDYKNVELPLVAESVHFSLWKNFESFLMKKNKLHHKRQL